MATVFNSLDGAQSILNKVFIDRFRAAILHQGQAGDAQYTSLEFAGAPLDIQMKAHSAEDTYGGRPLFSIHFKYPDAEDIRLYLTTEDYPVLFTLFCVLAMRYMWTGVDRDVLSLVSEINPWVENMEEAQWVKSMEKWLERSGFQCVRGKGNLELVSSSASTLYAVPGGTTCLNILYRKV